MSVVIKDFKIPKDCDHCAFQHEDDEDPFNRVWKCYITGESVSGYYEGSTYGNHPDTCPLIEVSEEVSEDGSEDDDEDSKIAKQAEMVIDGIFKTTRVVIFYKDVDWAKKVYEYIKKFAPYEAEYSASDFSSTAVIYIAERDINITFVRPENNVKKYDKVFYQPGIDNEITLSMWKSVKPVELNV